MTHDLVSMDLSGGVQMAFPWFEGQIALSVPPENLEPSQTFASTFPDPRPETAVIRGDLAQYTGNAIEKYGRTWHEYVFLEGAKKGQTGHCQRSKP
jgi:hypothetical protein